GSVTSDQDPAGAARSVSIAVKGTATLPLYAYSYGAAPGRTAFWSTWLYNTGTSAATPTINFSVPSGAVPMGATGCTDVTVDADVVSCTVAPIAPGGYAQPSFSATVDADTPIGSTVTGHFTVGTWVYDAPFTVPQDLSMLQSYLYGPYNG